MSFLSDFLKFKTHAMEEKIWWDCHMHGKCWSQLQKRRVSRQSVGIPTQYQQILRKGNVLLEWLTLEFVYTFGEKLYLQKSGGSIGVRVTMAVARIMMNNFGRKYR